MKLLRSRTTGSLEHRCEWLPEFEDSFDESSAWGPAKQIAAELANRGVDMTDREQVRQAVAGLNAERLPRSLLDE